MTNTAKSNRESCTTCIFVRQMGVANLCDMHYEKLIKVGKVKR